MIFCRYFLQTLSVCALIFSYRGLVDCAYAAGPNTNAAITPSFSNAELHNPTQIGGVTDDDIRAQRNDRIFSSADTEAATVTICSEGQYVSACGNYLVGFNWLRPASVPNPNHNDTEDSESENTQTTQDIPYKTTKNYYISNEITDLYQQMRTFFDKDATIIQYLNDETITNTADFADDREAILNNLCHPKNSNISCSPCPNNANVPPSTVKLDSNNLTIQYSWDFHTFADCYMTEFEDSTGSYFYVPDNRNIDSINEQDAEKCYYQNTTANAVDILGGTSIGTFILGISTNNSKFDISNKVLIPKTQILKH